MAETDATTVPLDADLVAAARDAARTNGRSTDAQVAHWARIGMELERRALADPGTRAVIAGEDEFSTLTPAGRAVAHAVIDARIAERAAAASFGEATVAAGHTAVSLDDAGSLIATDPDGTTRPL